MVPFLVTLLCCLFISLEYGILIGIAINLMFVLYTVARPQWSLIRRNMSITGNEVLVITPKDSLYFPAAGYLRDEVLRHGDHNLLVLFDGRNVKTIDSTVAKV